MNKEAVYEILREDKIKIYWQKKDGITNDAWDDINWKASKGALKEQPRGMKRFGAKFATRHITTGRMMKLRQEWTHSTCPQCGAPEETTEHVCKCPAEKAQEMWKISMKKLEDHLKAKDTEPAMRRRIMMHLESWHSMSPPMRNDNSHRQLAEALEAQNRSPLVDAAEAWEQTQQAVATEATNTRVNHLLDYCATYPNDGIFYQASSMILSAHSNAA